MRQVGITGTRSGGTDRQLKTLEEILERLKGIGYGILHHGDCVGVDAQADRIAKVLGYRTVAHPPRDVSYRAHTTGHMLEHEPRSYFDRNRKIVENSELLVGVPAQEDELLRSGTWFTIRHARRAHVTAIIVRPGGRITVEDNL